MTGRTAQTFNPPVVEAYSWLEGKDFSQRALINVSQAAPIAPPPAPLRAHMAKVIEEEDTHLYGAVLGLPALREELARHSSALYHGNVTAAQVAYNIRMQSSLQRDHCLFVLRW
jgi:aspartate/methionine/tyrosine aminotransferase